MKGLYQKNSKEAVLARKNPKYRHGRHCAFNLSVYLVFVTKYRGFDFSTKILSHINEIMGHICESYDARLVRFEGGNDHVQLLVQYPPKVAVSKLVNSLKAVSSRQLKKADYPEVRPKLWGNKLWATSYFAGPSSQEGLVMLKEFIQKQE